MNKKLIRTISSLLTVAILVTAIFYVWPPSSPVHAASGVTISDLKVCSLTEPLGIDVTPVFSWVLTGTQRGEAQSAYQIRLYTAPDETDQVWTSGMVESDQTLDIVYDGDPLTSKTTYYWTAEVWDHTGNSVKSDVERFSTGMEPDEWQGKWITASTPDIDLAFTGTPQAHWIWEQDGRAWNAIDAQEKLYVRKSFTPDQGKIIKNVYLGLTADDEYEFYFNEAYVAESRGPNWAQGYLFDLTEAARPGEKNVLAVEALNAGTGPGNAGFLARLEVHYTDGSKNTYVTNGANYAADPWKISREEQADWTKIDFDDNDWKQPDALRAYGESPWGSNVRPTVWDTQARAEVLLRKEFPVNKEVEEAYAYVCGLGFFDMTLNGEHPDDTVLNPFTSQYEETVLYRTFDVKELLNQGNNALAVGLGNSFYNEITGVWNWQNASWRDNPKLILNLEIRYADGTSETISTDTSWSSTKDGPIIDNNMYYGDIYDARKELPGFALPDYDESALNHAVEAKIPTGELKSHMKVPAKRVAEFTVQDIKKLDNGSYVITEPEMIAGWIKLSNINEAAGTEIRITYGQDLNEDGTVKKWGGPDGDAAGGGWNHWWPDRNIQQDHYICKGTANESYEPKYSWKGHMYIQIDGLTGELTKDDIISYRVSNGVDIISQFETSDDILNNMHKIMVNSLANNFHGEHCDPLLEKNGWTGDANVTLEALAYNFDITGTLPGWNQACEDFYKVYGNFNAMVPNANWISGNNDITWTSLYPFSAKAMDDYFGYKSYSEERYDMLRAFTELQMDELRNNNWVMTEGGYGDWVSPIGGTDPDSGYNENTSEGGGLVRTAYQYKTMSYMADLAERLGKTADAAQYREDMAKVYEAFNETYYKPELQIYDTNYWRQIGQRTKYRQTSNIVPIVFGLAPEEVIDGVMDNLVKDIIEKNYHLDTGIVGTKYILPLLTDYGYSDIAFKILTQKDYPSWGYMIEQSGVASWEMWENNTRSFDHYFLDTYDEWFFSHLAGITEVSDGYKEYTLKPYLVGDLTYTNASIDTVRGKMTSNWILNDDGTATFDIVVPFGATANLCLPTAEADGAMLDGQPVSTEQAGVKSVGLIDGQLWVSLGSGSYSFLSQTDLAPGYQPILTGSLSDLKVSNGVLSPAFRPGEKQYNLSLGSEWEAMEGIWFTPATDYQNAIITVNDKVVKNGKPVYIPVNSLDDTVTIRIREGTAYEDYTITFSGDVAIISPAGATAGQEYTAAQSVKNLINGSGMSDETLQATHDAAQSGGTMWHTDNRPGDPNDPWDLAWVNVDLGDQYNLDEMWIWNLNQGVADGPPRGLKNVKIQYSTDNQDWTDLMPPEGMVFQNNDPEMTPEYPFQFAIGTGMAGMPATNLNDGENTPVSFAGARARYVRIHANPAQGNGNWGWTCFGLSELRFTSKLDPADGLKYLDVELAAGDEKVILAPQTPVEEHSFYFQTSAEPHEVPVLDDDISMIPGAEPYTDGVNIDVSNGTRIYVAVYRVTSDRKIKAFGEAAATPAADKTALSQVLSSAASLAEQAYTKESWAVFAEKRNAAEGLRDDPAASQAAVDKAVRDLNNAIAALVRIKVNVPVSGVSLNKTALSLQVGKAEGLTARVAPANATNRGVKWISSAPGVAKVNDAGIVTAVAKGTAVVTVTTLDKGFTAKCTVTVTAPSKPEKKVKVTGITLNMRNKDLTKGKTAQLKATVSPAKATDKRVTWRSSKPRIVSVTSKGKIKALRNGKATITAKAGSKIARVRVRVGKKYVPVKKVKMKKTRLTLKRRRTTTLKAVITPKNVSIKKVTWKSSNPKVATVSSKGKVTAKKRGKTIITATTHEGGKVAKCRVTVK